MYPTRLVVNRNQWCWVLQSSGFWMCELHVLMFDSMLCWWDLLIVDNVLEICHLEILESLIVQNVLLNWTIFGSRVFYLCCHSFCSVAAWYFRIDVECIVLVSQWARSVSSWFIVTSGVRGLIEQRYFASCSWWPSALAILLRIPDKKLCEPHAVRTNKAGKVSPSGINKLKVGVSWAQVVDNRVPAIPTIATGGQVLTECREN